MIYKNRTNRLENIDFKEDYSNILINPAMVGREYWTKGYFYNISHNNTSSSQLDYGFYDIYNQRYVDEYNNVLDREPKIYGAFGVSTISGIACEINKELIMDETLLKVY